MRNAHSTEILEEGRLYFFCRPKVSAAEENIIPRSTADLQRFYMVMHPQAQRQYRLIIIGRKRLPKAREHQKFWAMLDMVTNKASEIKKVLQPKRYSSKTRGEREQPEAIACGEGKYVITRLHSNTYFAYQLITSPILHALQKALNIVPKAKYVISVKNQSRAGTLGGKTALFPERLQNKFHGRRFAAVNPVDFLNYPGAELLLIGASI